MTPDQLTRAVADGVALERFEPRSRQWVIATPVFTLGRVVESMRGLPCPEFRVYVDPGADIVLYGRVNAASLFLTRTCTASDNVQITFAGSSTDIKKIVYLDGAAPTDASTPVACNCRWVGGEQVQSCSFHEAHTIALHEWAERAKLAEATLAAVGPDTSELLERRGKKSIDADKPLPTIDS